MNVGNTYFITGRFSDMKKSMKVASEGRMTHLRVHAVMFRIDSEEKLAKVQTYLDELRQHHPEAVWGTKLVCRGV